MWTDIDNRLKSIGSLVSKNTLTILSIYLCTFFVYRDLGIRMIYGYLILIILILIMIYSFIRNKKRIILEELNKLQIVIGLFIIISLLRPSARRDSDTIAYMVMMVITILFSILGQRNSSDIMKAAKIFIMTAILFSIYILFLQIFQDLFWQYIFPFLSELSQERALKYAFNGYSVMIGRSYTYMDYILTMGLGFIWSYNSDENDVVFTRIKISIVILLFFTVIVVGRRGELFALIVSIIVMYLLTSDSQTIHVRVKNILSVLLFSIIIITIIMIFFKDVPFLQRYIRTIESLLGLGDMKGGVTSGRISLYSDAFRQFLKNPIFGGGWGSFANNIDQNVLIMHTNQITDVHNFYLQLLSEVGLFGTLAVITPMFLIFKNTLTLNLNLWRNKQNKDFDNILLVSVFLSMFYQVFMLLLTFIDPITYKFEFWILYFITIYLTSYGSSKLYGVNKKI